jgi:hypothetical protein
VMRLWLGGVVVRKRRVRGSALNLVGEQARF